MTVATILCPTESRAIFSVPIRLTNFPAGRSIALVMPGRIARIFAKRRTIDAKPIRRTNFRAKFVT